MPFRPLMPSHPLFPYPVVDRRSARAQAARGRTALPVTLAGLLALAIAATATLAQAGDRQATDTPPQVARAAAGPSLDAVSYGCGWAEKRLADPAWRPFLSRVTRACQAIADNPAPRQITQQAYRERAFTAALDRAAHGLDALYLEMWRVRLADERAPLATAVALNDTGVFLTLQHERVFRLAERIVLHYDAGGRTAWLR